jgi:hypothetical protein
MSKALSFEDLLKSISITKKSNKNLSINNNYKIIINNINNSDEDNYNNLIKNFLIFN